MTSSRLALVAADATLAHAIQNHLAKTVGRSALICPMESIRDRIGPDTDGLLLLVARDPADAALVVQLVQEISLKKLPPIVLIAHGESAAQLFELAGVDRYIERRLSWPEDAPALESLVRRRIGRGPKFPDPGEEPLVELIARRLLVQTPSLQSLSESLALASVHDVPVLLSGETGTGKTYLARLMHELSARKDNRFLAVSRGALAPNLIESEFFGHVKGAFTGADQAKEGKFAAAGNGTLLLDEIDTLRLEQQTSLLRVLETGEYEPVGSNKTQKCTARIIVASNWDLEEAVDKGKFRRDLYYRLHVMSFRLPPLRERVQDIAPLVRGMTAYFNAKFRKALFEIRPEVIATMERLPWPGNIRQLENVVQQAVLVSSGPELLLAHFPPSVHKHPALSNGHANGVALAVGDSLAQNRQGVERIAIQRALLNCGNSRTDAAHVLGISRVTLYKKMKKYGLLVDGDEQAPVVKNGR